VEHRVLIVDDLPEYADLIRLQIRRLGFPTEIAHSGAQAMKVIQAGFLGIIVLDVMLPDVEGLELLNRIQEVSKDSPIIIITAHGTIDLATEAIKQGAYDFILKENLGDRLELSVKNAARALELSTRVEHLSAELQDRSGFHNIISQSSKMKRIFETLRQVVDSNVSVLIQGESGTGKELVAKAIHFSSSRARGPFIAINCAGIPSSLLESELFGYEKGAFTGADQRRVGKFEAANGGTIFLDEIGEMDLNLQSKLLRVVQEREVEPLGSNESRPLDIRVLSATNRELLVEVDEKRFREDLYYRLAVFPIILPPLRDRREDIILLAQHFIERIVKEEPNKSSRTLSKKALQALDRYHFPGNVRELENVISHAMVTATGTHIQLEDLPALVLHGRASKQIPAYGGPSQNEVKYQALVEQLKARVESYEARIFELNKKLEVKLTGYQDSLETIAHLSREEAASRLEDEVFDERFQLRERELIDSWSEELAQVRALEDEYTEKLRGLARMTRAEAENLIMRTASEDLDEDTRLQIAKHFDFDTLLKLGVPIPEKMPPFEEVEKSVFTHTWRVCDKNVKKAAEVLGVSRPRIYRKLGDQIRRGERR
jgi:two-component system, NtrC family, nitrogen regulation response regulator GlnG